MTDQEKMLNEAASKLPDPNSYKDNVFTVKFNTDDHTGNAILKVDQNFIPDFNNKLPCIVYFKKVPSKDVNGMYDWEIMNEDYSNYK
jgi:hypothetical protein